MIWYFLAGWLAGWVGCFMFAGWWVRKHTVYRRVRKVEQDVMDEMLEALKTENFQTGEEFLRRLDEIENKRKGEKSDD